MLKINKNSIKDLFPEGREGNFNLSSDFSPGGDQIHAITELKKGINEREQNQVLLGVTGSGKTFTMGNVIKL